MRIIGGSLKGKKISFIKSKTTRPLRDLVKENIFNIIQHSNEISAPIVGSNILDLFSGTGSFGIECISRGANHVTFVEENIQTLSVLKTNINLLGINDKVKIVEKNIKLYFEENSFKKKFDIIFLDPPYKDKKLKDILIEIKLKKISSSNQLIIIHREFDEIIKYENIIKIFKVKNYGRSKIIFGFLT